MALKLMMLEICKLEIFVQCLGPMIYSGRATKLCPKANTFSTNMASITSGCLIVMELVPAAIRSIRTMILLFFPWICLVSHGHFECLQLLKYPFENLCENEELTGESDLEWSNPLLISHFLLNPQCLTHKGLAFLHPRVSSILRTGNFSCGENSGHFLSDS